MKISQIISVLTTSLFAIAMFAQTYSTVATRAYCDRNRQLASFDAAAIANTNIPTVVSQQVVVIFGNAITNLYNNISVDLGSFMMVTNNNLYIYKDNLCIWTSE